MSAKQEPVASLVASRVNITTQTIGAFSLAPMTALEHCAALFDALELSPPRSALHLGALEQGRTGVRTRQLDWHLGQTRLALLSARFLALVSARGECVATRFGAVDSFGLVVASHVSSRVSTHRHELVDSDRANVVALARMRAWLLTFVAASRQCLVARARTLELFVLAVERVTSQRALVAACESMFAFQLTTAVRPQHEIGWCLRQQIVLRM